MITSELLRIRFSLTAKIILALVLAEAVGIGLLFAFLPTLIDGLIALGDVIPNATSADQFSDQQFQALTLGSPVTQQVVIDLLGNSGTGIGFPAIAALLLGALTITTEHRRGSLTASALAEPRRAPLLLAKLAALTATVAAACVVLVIVRGLMLAAGLALQGEPLLLEPTAVLGAWGRDETALIIYAGLGFAVGLLARSPIAAMVVLGGAVVVETIVRPVTMLSFGAPNLAMLLPFGLVPDISGTNPLAAINSVTVAASGIAPIPALFVLAAWAILICATASVRLIHTDLPDRQWTKSVRLPALPHRSSRA